MDIPEGWGNEMSLGDMTAYEMIQEWKKLKYEEEQRKKKEWEPEDKMAYVQHTYLMAQICRKSIH